MSLYIGCVSVLLPVCTANFRRFNWRRVLSAVSNTGHVRKRICETTVRFRRKKSWHEKISGCARMDIIFRDRWALIVRDSRHKESHRVIHLSISERLQNASHIVRTGTDSNDEIISWIENDWDCPRHHLDLFPLGKSVCRMF